MYAKYFSSNRQRRETGLSVLPMRVVFKTITLPKPWNRLLKRCWLEQCTPVYKPCPNIKYVYHNSSHLELIIRSKASKASSLDRVASLEPTPVMAGALIFGHVGNCGADDFAAWNTNRAITSP